MAKLVPKSTNPVILIYIIFRLSCNAEALAVRLRPDEDVSAIFAFGDSTVDPGNNNNLVTPFKSDFPPYGRDFPGHQPTGRFTDGKLITDFVASHLGLKEEVPAYLDSSLSSDDLMSGVSFASAGSGFDPLTSQISGVIPMEQQLSYFREYLTQTQLLIGEKQSEDLINRAVFVISAGTNDFVANYITLPFRRQSFSIDQYQALIIQRAEGFLQGLYDLGAQRIIVVGLPPMGCLPIVITLSTEGGVDDQGCVWAYNSMAMNYNKMLQVMLQKYSTFNQGQVLYLDVYKALIALILSPDKYGIAETAEGCCGTGLIEAAVLCNLKSIVCPDASKYIFWDSIHPTQKAYFIMFSSFWPMINLFLKTSHV